MSTITIDEPETLSIQDFQPSYQYSEDEIELMSYPDFLEIVFSGEVIKQIKLPSHLHQRYFASYRKDLKRKLEVLSPYLSGIESFLTMVFNLPAGKDSEIEFLIKSEIYRLP